jgi:hypothetical protein
MSDAAIPIPRSASLARALKLAWLSFWFALIVNFVAWSLLGSQVILMGFYLVVGCSLWLAWTTARAASFAGHTGILWAVGVVALGPLGALLLPWAALSKLLSAK